MMNKITFKLYDRFEWWIEGIASIVSLGMARPPQDHMKWNHKKRVKKAQKLCNHISSTFREEDTYTVFTCLTCDFVEVNKI